MNFAFYISGKGTRLRKILDENNSDLLKDTKVIFSDSEESLYLMEKLDLLNIKYVFFDYKKVKSEDKNSILSDNLLGYLKKYNIDFCFCFGSHILRGKLLDEFDKRIINFHPSILPFFRGIKAIDKAVESNVHILGNSAHFIDKDVDTGPIIMQNIIPIQTFYEFGYDGVLDKQIPMLYQIYEWLINERITIKNNIVKIKDADYGVVEYFPRLDK